MLRSRLAEHYNRIVREDCIALFNKTIDLRQIECSIVLSNASQLAPETKYKAAAALTVLTGQRPAGEKCKTEWEDPLAQHLSRAQLAAENQRRSAQLARQWAATKGPKKGAKPGAKRMAKQQLTADDFKEAAAGFKLETTLGKVRMWAFLERLREFCLPDVTGAIEDSLLGSGKRETDERGHDNDRDDAVIRRQFQVLRQSKRSIYSPRLSIRPEAEQPDEASTAYVLKAHELLKFPDIEVHFEALGSVLTDTRLGHGSATVNSPNSVRLILRPLLRVSESTASWKTDNELLPWVDHLRMMNWLLSHYFNEHLQRPILGRW